MAKFMFIADYTAEGIKGVVKGGGTAVGRCHQRGLQGSRWLYGELSLRVRW